MERVFGHECIYLAAWDDASALAGVLPLVRVKSMLFGHFLVSMPFLNYGGPLGIRDAIVALVAHASALARDDRRKAARAAQSHPAARSSFPCRIARSPCCSICRTSEPALMKQLDAKLRSQVRRPQKEGVTVKFGADQVAPFFDVSRTTCATSARPRSRASSSRRSPPPFRTTRGSAARGTRGVPSRAAAPSSGETKWR